MTDLTNSCMCMYYECKHIEILLNITNQVCSLLCLFVCLFSESKPWKIKRIQERLTLPQETPRREERILVRLSISESTVPEWGPSTTEGPDVRSLYKWIQHSLWYILSDMCYGLNVSVLPIFICWSLSPIMVIFGGASFGKWLGHEGRNLMDEISVLLRGESWEFPSLGSICHVRMRERRQLSANPQEGSHQNLIIWAPWPQFSNAVRN